MAWISFSPPLSAPHHQIDRQKEHEHDSATMEFDFCDPLFCNKF